MDNRRVVEIFLPKPGVPTNPSIPSTHAQAYTLGNTPHATDPFSYSSQPYRPISDLTPASPKAHGQANKSPHDSISLATSQTHQRHVSFDRTPTLIDDDKGRNTSALKDPFKKFTQVEIHHNANRAQPPSPPPNWVARFKQQTREFWAEFFGTAILLFFGIGANCQVGLGSSTEVSKQSFGDNTTICLAWGVGLMAGLYISSGISGGHLNPAVTLTLTLLRGFPLKKLFIYITAQILGAFVGGGLVYVNYSHAISLFEGGAGVRTLEKSGSLLFTSPLPYVSNLNGFFNEFLATIVLVIFVMAVNDNGNLSPPAGTPPFVILWVFFAIAATMGMQTGFAFNPARDIGPRFVAWIAGYGRDVWTFRNWYWLWCPTLAPICGAILGGLIYDALIASDAIDSPLNKPFSIHHPFLLSKKNTKGHTSDMVSIQK